MKETLKTYTKADTYIVNHCAKTFGRDVLDERHNYGQYVVDSRNGQVVEAWRFPIVDSYRDATDPNSYLYNEVTFIYATDQPDGSASVQVIGTFGGLDTAWPLKQVGSSRYYTLTGVVPKGEVHYYKFLVDGKLLIDPINPQQIVRENGALWSRFFTNGCSHPITFEPWEWVILERFTDHILPFRTKDARIFLDRYYNNLDRPTKDDQMPRAYLLDQSVGVVNYIDKILAREESHRLKDYRVALELIDQLLRKRYVGTEPANVSREAYVDLYNQMGSNQVLGWNYNRYQSPRFFLQLLRRHTLTGAFCHPKYGGNAQCAGWAFLADRYQDSQNKTLFDWPLAIEAPFGKSGEYYG